MTSLREYDIDCRPSPSIPAETLIQDGHHTYLLFFAVSKMVDSSGYLTDLGVAVLKCNRCASAKFGYPNDEGRPEHPLIGAEYQTMKSPAVEVLDSPWAAELSRQMQASAQRIWGQRGINPGPGEKRALRHFIITLKEATFECVATKMTVIKYFPTFKAATGYVLSQLGDT